MGVGNFGELLKNKKHKIVYITIGTLPANIGVECETCGKVLIDFDYH